MEAKLAARIAKLATVTDEPGRITRTLLSPAMAEAARLVYGWMTDAGLEARIDALGSVIGHLPGATPEAGTLLLGSHLDTVRNGGGYDGPAGIVTALAALEDLRERGVILPFDVDVLAFADEEGVRFGTPYLGSKAVTGQLEPEDLLLRDRDGITLAQASDLAEPPVSLYVAKRLLGYVEAHIEQGPVLERREAPLGVVTHIAAQVRLEAVFTGVAGHAGTTPMAGRQDALCAAAAFILAVEDLGRHTEGLVATVGRVHVSPNAGNVIPGEVVLSVDLRHAETWAVTHARELLEERAAHSAQERGVTARVRTLLVQEEVDCDAALLSKLAKAAHEPPRLVSGAGHDGVILSRIAPVGMLFIRCRDGLSHHPDEYAAPDDLAAAARALARFLEDFAK
ncbi:MAG: M20 family metallo-hydrolase [Verrucomicrobium sp.]|nr:M20 family metallo-hydrolase [Verrucomicrobium sp.]